jgi:hypothetical protein
VESPKSPEVARGHHAGFSVSVSACPSQ